jgi:hypothetical protein
MAICVLNLAESNFEMTGNSFPFPADFGERLYLDPLITG